MSSFIDNKNKVNWTSITQVITRLINTVRFHRHTRQPNISSIYTSLKSEFGFDQNYKVLLDIIKFSEHQKSLDLDLYNSRYASFNMTGLPPLFFQISNFQTLIEEQLIFTKLGRTYQN